MNYTLTAESVNGIPVYMSKTLLEKYRILVAFSTRSGGWSGAPYDSLNLAFHVGDDETSVTHNREALCAIFDLDPSGLTCAEQVHGCEVAVVDRVAAGAGARSFDGAVRGVDALITDVESVPLALFFADCVPVVIVEPRQRVVGVAHAGWRGVYLGIAGRMLREMAMGWSLDPRTMVAFVGPSIGGCCYQVGGDLIERFTDRFPDVDSWLHDDRLDLPVLVRHQLRQAGIDRSSIFSCDDCCTACHRDALFSYRADGGVTGRQAAVAAVLPRIDFGRNVDLY